MKTELEVLEVINQKLDDSTKEGKEVKALVTEAKKEADALKLEVATLNTELKAKDATLGEIQTEVKELKAKSGRFRGEAKTKIYIGDLISDAIFEHKAEIENMAFKDKPLQLMEKKAVGPILSANLTGTGNNYITYLDWQAGMEPIGQFRFRQIFRTVNSETDFVRFPRANTPIGEGSFAYTADGSTKPQVDRDYTMIDLTLQAMAGFTIVSRQALRNIVFLQSWLPTSLMEQLLDTEDTEFANALVAAATGSTSTTGVVTTAGQIGKLVAYIKNLIQRKYKPNFIAVDPNIWANLTLTQSSGSELLFNLPNVVVVTPDGMVRILGIPVYPVNWLTGGRVIVGDSTKAAIVQSEGLTLRQSDSHASIFTANEICFLMERVEGLMVNRTDAFSTAVLP